MIAFTLTALVCGLGLLILTVGYAYGRAETEAHYEPIVAELEDTIAALLPTGVRVLP